MANIIGNNPDVWVKNQVNLRQQLLGLKNQPPEVLAWQNNKTAWIRAISAVTMTSEKAKELVGRENYGGGKLAQEYVLFNGTIGLEQQTDGNGNITYNQKTNSGVYDGRSPNNSVYGFEYDGKTIGGKSSSERGLVPMPGISDLTISTYNRGSLRRASLKIKAYNSQQFAALDALFMRPGYTLLIEWGHTAYFTGTPESPLYKTAKFNTKPFLLLNKFLEGKAEGNQTNILKSIKRERGNGTVSEFDIVNNPSGTSEGNYDGFYGKVTNFVWSLNSDGSYNIEVKAISTGDIIESLTIDQVSSDVDSKADKIQNVINADYGSEVDDTEYYIFDLTDKQGNSYTRKVPDNKKHHYKEYWDAVQRSNREFSLNFDKIKNPPAPPQDNFSMYSTPVQQSNYVSDPQQNLFDNTTFDKQKANDALTGKTETVAGLQERVTPETSALITQYRASLKNYPGKMKRNTLGPPANTLSKEEEGPQVLLINKDRSKLNKFLFKNFNHLTTKFRKNSKFIETSSNSSTKKPVYNTFGEPNTLPFPDFYDLVMIQPKVQVEQTHGVTGNTSRVLIDSKEAPYQYIKLNRLLEFIEEELLIYNGGKENKEGDDQQNQPPSPIVSFDLDGENYMYTHPTQFSSDPNVCIIPFSFPTPKSENSGPKQLEREETGNNVLDVFKGNVDYFDKVLEGCNFRHESSDFVAHMLNIPVNLHYIGTIIQQTTTNNSIPLLRFLEQLMYGIQEALGSINKFSVTYDHDSNQIVFRDDVPLDPRVATKTKVPVEQRTLFNVNGWKPTHQNGSFVTNVNLTTTLSNKFATMISIGAQSQKASDVANSTSFSRWNEGLTDSVTPSKLSKAGLKSSKSQANEPKSLFNTSIVSLNKPSALIPSFYKNVLMPSGNVQSTAQSLNSNFNKYISTVLTPTETPSSQGFIPFSMNLDMDGFSGIKIYEKFYITTEILPPSYPKTLSFICKGLTHTVNSNGWKTKIDSLTITSVDDDNKGFTTPMNEIDTSTSLRSY